MASSGTIRALLESGACVNSRTRDGNTPLHLACFGLLVCIDTEDYLLRWGANEELTNDNGKTADELVGYRVSAVDTRSEERKSEDRRLHQRVRQMIARAPADRSWRRGGWLVLARSCPAKVQLVHGSGADNGGSSAKTAKPNHGGGGEQQGRRNGRLGTLGRQSGQPGCGLRFPLGGGLRVRCERR